MKLRKLAALGMAAVMAAGTLAGCGGNDKKETASNEGGDEIVNLKWVIVGNGMPENYDSWSATLNEYLGEKIGVNVEMEVIPWGNWDDRRNIIISTNEPYDIIFGNGNNYNADIKLGAYADLTDMIDEYMPEFKELMPEKYWDAVRAVDGQIYGIPAYKDSSISNYSVWDKELVEEYSIDTSKYEDLKDLTPLFEQLKADKNDYPVYVKNDGVYMIFDKYDQIGTGAQIIGVRYDDKDAKVCFTLEEDDVFADLQTFHEWYKKGIINPDAATLTEARKYNMWRIAQGWESAGETVWGPDMGKEVTVEKWGDTILSNDTVRAL